MKYPKLVRNPKQEVTVCIGEPHINNDGERVNSEEKQLKCYLQMNAYDKITPDKRVVTLSGKALFDGDIFPDQTVLPSGKLTYEGQTYDIYKGSKNYNPDGTVNYTTLELI